MGAGSTHSICSDWYAAWGGRGATCHVRAHTYRTHAHCINMPPAHAGRLHKHTCQQAPPGIRHARIIMMHHAGHVVHVVFSLTCTPHECTHVATPRGAPSSNSCAHRCTCACTRRHAGACTRRHADTVYGGGEDCACQELQGGQPSCGLSVCASEPRGFFSGISRVVRCAQIAHQHACQCLAFHQASKGGWPHAFPPHRTAPHQESCAQIPRCSPCVCKRAAGAGTRRRTRAGDRQQQQFTLLALSDPAAVPCGRPPRGWAGGCSLARHHHGGRRGSQQHQRTAQAAAGPH